MNKYVVIKGIGILLTFYSAIYTMEMPPDLQELPMETVPNDVVQAASFDNSNTFNIGELVITSVIICGLEVYFYAVVTGINEKYIDLSGSNLARKVRMISLKNRFHSHIFSRSSSLVGKLGALRNNNNPNAAPTDIEKLSNEITTHQELADALADVPANQHCQLVKLVVEKHPFNLNIALFLINKYCGPEFRLLPRGNDRYYVLDTATEDTFTLESFKSLIQESVNENKPFILAVGITKSQGKEIIHYFDALSLNKYLETVFPQSCSSLSKANPINRQLFTTIHYFILYPGEQLFKPIDAMTLQNKFQ